MLPIVVVCYVCFVYFVRTNLKVRTFWPIPTFRDTFKGQFEVEDLFLRVRIQFGRNECISECPHYDSYTNMCVTCELCGLSFTRVCEHDCVSSCRIKRLLS